MCREEEKKEKKIGGFSDRTKTKHLCRRGGSRRERKTTLSKKLPIDDAITFLGGMGYQVSGRPAKKKKKSHNNTQNQSRQDSQVSHFSNVSKVFDRKPFLLGRRRVARAASFRPPLLNKPLLPPSLPYSGLHMRGYGGVFISHRGSHLIPVRVDCKRLITKFKGCQEGRFGKSYGLFEETLSCLQIPCSGSNSSGIQDRSKQFPSRPLLY